MTDRIEKIPSWAWRAASMLAWVIVVALLSYIGNSIGSDLDTLQVDMNDVKQRVGKIETHQIDQDRQLGEIKSEMKEDNRLNSLPGSIRIAGAEPVENNRRGVER